MGHGDEHAHQHHHSPAPAEAHNASAGQGPVLLDVGPGAGALVLLAAPDLRDVEVEVSPVGRDGERTHVAVLARPAGGRQVHAAVYPSLASGRWTVWDPREDRPLLVVDVPDGGVTEASWPAQR